MEEKFPQEICLCLNSHLLFSDDVEHLVRKCPFEAGHFDIERLISGRLRFWRHAGVLCLFLSPRRQSKLVVVVPFFDLIEPDLLVDDRCKIWSYDFVIIAVSNHKAETVWNGKPRN